MGNRSAGSDDSGDCNLLAHSRLNPCAEKVLSCMARGPRLHVNQALPDVPSGLTWKAGNALLLLH